MVGRGVESICCSEFSKDAGVASGVWVTRGAVCSNSCAYTRDIRKGLTKSVSPATSEKNVRENLFLTEFYKLSTCDILRFAQSSVKN